MKTLQDWITEKTQKIADAGTIPMEKAGLCWDLTDRESWPDPGLPCGQPRRRRGGR